MCKTSKSEKNIIFSMVKWKFLFHKHKIIVQVYYHDYRIMVLYTKYVLSMSCIS